jgi:hypothetical protein
LRRLLRRRHPAPAAHAEPPTRAPRWDSHGSRRARAPAGTWPAAVAACSARRTQPHQSELVRQVLHVRPPQLPELDPAEPR